MSKRTTGWLHPALIYLILLILVIIVSWIGSIMEIGRGAGNEELDSAVCSGYRACVGLSVPPQHAWAMPP